MAFSRTTNATTVAATGSRSADLSGFYYKEHVGEGFGGDLSNPVHPLFEWSKFSGGSIEAGDEALTLMARRLASRYVTADCFLPYWHSILFGKRVKLNSVPEPQSTWRFQFEIEEPLTTLSLEQVADTRKRLVDLASNVTFDIGNANVAGGKYVICAMAMRNHRAALPFTGFCSTIYAHVNFWAQFRQGRSAESDALQKAYANVVMAMALSHEMAHAAIHATADRSEWDRSFGNPHYYIGNGMIAEDGYEFQYRCLGGLLERDSDENSPAAFYTIDGVDTGLKGVLVMFDWPVSPLVRSYVAREFLIGVRGEIPKGWLKWRVPASYLQDQLTDAHWEGRVKHEGLVAVRPRREVALAFARTDGPNRSDELLISKDNIHEAPAVPEGFELFENGIVLRISQWLASDRMDLDDAEGSW